MIHIYKIRNDLHLHNSKNSFLNYLFLIAGQTAEPNRLNLVEGSHGYKSLKLWILFELLKSRFKTKQEKTAEVTLSNLT